MMTAQADWDNSYRKAEADILKTDKIYHKIKNITRNKGPFIMIKCSIVQEAISINVDTPNNRAPKFMK